MAKHRYEAYWDGELVGTRKSARTYTHCVVLCSSKEHAKQRALNFQPSESDRSNYTYYAKCAALPKEGGQYEGYSKTARANLSHWVSAEQVEKYRQWIADFPTFEDYAEHLKEQAWYAFQSRDFEPFVDGWCGRLDLAEKLAAKYRGKPEYDVVAVVETVIA